MSANENLFENNQCLGKRYRVLIVVSRFYMGGYTKSLQYLLECLKEYSEIDVTILSLESNHTSLKQQIPNTVPVIELGGLKYKGFAPNGKRRYYFLYFEGWLRILSHLLAKVSPLLHTDKLSVALIQQLCWMSVNRISNDFSFCSEYDCVVSWEELTCLYLVARRIECQRKVGYIRPNYTGAGFCRSVDLHCIKRIDAIAAVAESCVQTLRQVFPSQRDKFIYVPNRKSVNLLRNYANEKVDIDLKKCVKFITVARLEDRSKGLFRIVCVAKQLQKEGIPFVWYIIGDGPDRKELEKHIQNSTLENEIILMGELDNPYPYVKQADVFVLPSYYEGRPNAVDEAKIIGTPVVVTNYSSAHEQVSTEEGYIVDNEENAILQQLRDIALHPQMLRDKSEYLREKDWSCFEDCQAFLSLIGKA